MPALEIIKSTYQFQDWASVIYGKPGDRMRSRFLCDQFTLDSRSCFFYTGHRPCGVHNVGFLVWACTLVIWHIWATDVVEGTS